MKTYLSTIYFTLRTVYTFKSLYNRTNYSVRVVLYKYRHINESIDTSPNFFNQSCIEYITYQRIYSLLSTLYTLHCTAVLYPSYIAQGSGSLRRGLLRRVAGGLLLLAPREGVEVAGGLLLLALRDGVRGGFLREEDATVDFTGATVDFTGVICLVRGALACATGAVAWLLPCTLMSLTCSFS